jgi:hypothetical protein
LGRASTVVERLIHIRGRVFVRFYALSPRLLYIPGMVVEKVTPLEHRVFLVGLYAVFYLLIIHPPNRGRGFGGLALFSIE